MGRGGGCPVCIHEVAGGYIGGFMSMASFPESEELRNPSEQNKHISTDFYKKEKNPKQFTHPHSSSSIPLNASTTLD